MKTNSWRDLMHQVKEQGVVVEEQLTARIEEEHSIKYVFLKIVAIVGSLLAMGFFFGFLFLTIGDGLGFAAFALFGTLLYALSFLGNKKSEPALRDGVFVATYCSAFACFLAAFFDLQTSDSVNCLVVLLLSAVGLVSFKSKIIQFLSVLGGYYGLIYLLKFNHLGYMALALFWVVLVGVFLLFTKELQLKIKGTFLAQKHTALTNGLFCILFFEVMLDNLALIQPSSWINHTRYVEFNLIGNRFYLAFVGVILLGLTYFTIQQIGRSIPFKQPNLLSGGCALFILSLAFFIHGFGMSLAISIFLLVWAYHFRFQKGVVVAIVMLLSSLVCYYYYLQVSLLVKSLILMGCGLLFMSVFVIYNRLNREK